MLRLPEEIDKRLRWPFGRAERFARRGKIPHIVLPDGSIRFREDEVQNLLKEKPDRQTFDTKSAAKILGVKPAEIRKLAKRLGVKNRTQFEFQHLLAILLCKRCIQKRWPEENVIEIAEEIAKPPGHEARRAVVAITGGGLIHVQVMDVKLDEAIAAFRNAEAGGPTDD